MENRGGRPRESEASELFARVVLETRCDGCKRGFTPDELGARCPNPDCANYPGGERLAVPVHPPMDWGLLGGEAHPTTTTRVFRPRRAMHPRTGAVWFWEEMT